MDPEAAAAAGLIHCPTCSVCPTCGGAHYIVPLTIKDKLARHLMLNPGAGLVFDPQETHELGQLLGLIPGGADETPG